MHRLWSLRAIALAGLVCARPALAQAPASSPEDRAMAQTLFDQATTLMKSGKNDEACPKLEASLQRFDGIGTRGKLAQCYELVGRVASAWAMYREVVALATKAGDAQRAKIAQAAAEKLAPRVPYLTIHASAGLDGLVVTHNGRELSSGAFGTPIAVDPGQQRLEARAPLHQPWQGEVTLAEAERQTVEVPALVALPQRAEAPEPGPVPRAPVVEEEAPAGTPWRTLAVVSAGAGVVGLAVGGYFGLRATSKWNDAFDNGHCESQTNSCDARGQELTDQSRSAAVASNVAVGVGGALVATGVALWFLAPTERPTPGAKVQVVPVAELRRGGVWLQGSF